LPREAKTVAKITVNYDQKSYPFDTTSTRREEAERFLRQKGVPEKAISHICQDAYEKGKAGTYTTKADGGSSSCR
jgi:hypothetical protein